MAEFFTNYPQAQKPMSLGEMLNMAGGVQQYQQAQQMNPLALQKAQMEVEQSKQMNPLAVQKAQEEVSQAKIGTQEKQYGFNDKQARGVFSAIGGIMQDKRLQGGKEDVLAALLEAKQRAAVTGANPVILEGVFAPLVSQALDKPEMVKNSIGSIIREGMSSEAKQNAITGQENVQGTDIYGNPQVVQTSPVTGEKVQKPLPTVFGTAGTPTGVKASDMGLRFAPGESAGTVDAMQAERAQAKQAASAAAPALTNIETIRKYLPLAQTGKYSEAIAGLQSAFGNLAGSTPEEKAASARDIVQKNIADLGLQKNAALGNKFAADLSAVQQSIADAGKNPTAILKSMEQLQPLIQHAQLYQQGLEKAIEKNGGNIQVKRKYDNDMVTAFDPQALMVYNAYKAGDKKAFAGLSDTQKQQLFAKIERYARLVNGDL